jgi:hypothetical protein
MKLTLTGYTAVLHLAPPAKLPHNDSTQLISEYASAANEHRNSTN